jgi:hypothetical protein
MSFPRQQTLGAMAAPLERLSCPYSRKVRSEPHRSFRAFGTGNRSGCNARGLLTTNYWNPPTSAHQHDRQRVLTLVLAFILAAVLAQAGW